MLRGWSGARERMHGGHGGRRAPASHPQRGHRFAPQLVMLTILIVIGLIAVLGGGLGYNKFGAAGLSPAALIVLILIVLALTGRL